MSGRVTIKSIARDLGVSHMTVSRALANHPSVHPETRLAVQARAEQVGYVRSAAARAMRGAESGIVGLLLPNLTNEFYARFADALARACEERAQQLIIHLTNDDPAAEGRSLLRLREVQAAAVVMVPTRGDTIAVAPEGAFRLLHFIRQRGQIPALVVDDAPAIAAAVNLLVERGHRWIGYIGADKGMSSGRERLAAFVGAMDRHGLSTGSAGVITGAPSFLMGQDSAALLLSASPRITALLCGGFEISNGALNACLRRGLRMPQDLAFVGYGDPRSYQWIAGGVTTLRLPVEELATRAMALISGPETGLRHAMPVELVQRSTA